MAEFNEHDGVAVANEGAAVAICVVRIGTSSGRSGGARRRGIRAS